MIAQAWTIPLPPRWLFWPGVALGAMMVALAARYIYLHDPAESALFPVCLFHKLTGLSCPGCGLQRAIHDLLHGRLWSAFCHNPLAFAAAALLALHRISRQSPTARRWSPLDRVHAGRFMLAMVLVFWIGRNLMG